MFAVICRRGRSRRYPTLTDTKSPQYSDRTVAATVALGDRPSRRPDSGKQALVATFSASSVSLEGAQQFSEFRAGPDLTKRDHLRDLPTGQHSRNFATLFASETVRPAPDEHVSTPRKLATSQSELEIDSNRRPFAPGHWDQAYLIDSTSRSATFWLLSRWPFREIAREIAREVPGWIPSPSFQSFGCLLWHHCGRLTLQVCRGSVEMGPRFLTIAWGRPWRFGSGMLCTSSLAAITTIKLPLRETPAKSTHTTTDPRCPLQ